MRTSMGFLITTSPMVSSFISRSRTSILVEPRLAGHPEGQSHFNRADKALLIIEPLINRNSTVLSSRSICRLLIRLVAGLSWKLPLSTGRYSPASTLTCLSSEHPSSKVMVSPNETTVVVIKTIIERFGFLIWHLNYLGSFPCRYSLLGLQFPARLIEWATRAAFANWLLRASTDSTSTTPGHSRSGMSAVCWPACREGMFLAIINREATGKCHIQTEVHVGARG